MITYQAISKNAKMFPEKVAIKDDLKSITWEEYEKLVENAVVNLEEKIGLSNVKRAIVISKNRWELLVLYSALATCKIPYAGVDYTFSKEQKAHCIETLKPELIISSDEFIDDVKASGVNMINIDKDFDAIISESIGASEVMEQILEKGSMRKFESFSFTSGTSGFPKIVHRTKSFAQRRNQKFIEMYGFESSNIFLVTVPFYHVSIAGWLRMFMSIGCTAVLSDFNNPKDIYEKMINEKVTSSLIVPPVMTKLLNYMEDKPKENSLKFIIVGGKNFPAAIKKKAISFLGPVIHEYYGSTETGINVLADSEHMLQNSYSSGVTMEGSCILILDDDLKPLPYGKVGRIAIHSYQNAQDYLNTKLNEIVLYDKQYIITADNGYMDEFGDLYVVCRADLMEVAVDFNLYKAENLIRLISGIDDVFICTKKGDTQPIVKVYIAAHESSIEDKKSDITDIIHCIIKTKAKIEVKVVEKIPYSLSGKVKSKELED